MGLRIGTDLVAVDSVREALDAHAEHYLARIYTEGEIRDCTTEAGLDVERLAARFAAKEATLKVLRPDEHGVPWTSIEVRREGAGWVEIELSGVAAELARAAGVEDLALSISHEHGFASAVAVAFTRSGSRVRTR